MDTHGPGDVRLQRLLHQRLRRGLRDPGRPPLAAAGRPAPLDQYGAHGVRELGGRGPGLQRRLPDQYNYGNTIPTALAQNITTQTDIYNVGDVDTSLVRLFTARIETGEFDAEAQVPWVAAARAALGGTTWVNSNANNAVTETPARLAQARRAADQSIVLLKNQRRRAARARLLPLKVPAPAPYKVAVMGYYANPRGACSSVATQASRVRPGQAKEVNGYQGIKAAVQAINPDATVDYLPGVTGGTTGSTLNTVDQASVTAAQNYDAVVVVVGHRLQHLRRGSRPDLARPAGRPGVDDQPDRGGQPEHDRLPGDRRRG